jgi:3-deoxy-D-manno-octulosonic acid kinase
MLERLAIDRGAILYDPRRVPEPGAQFFDPAHWRARGAARELAAGRGSILLIEEGQRDWVLRRYLRGGFAARFARDLYFWLGEDRTRSFRELRLLAAMRAQGLPVPVPVAGCYRRAGFGYRAELLTERLVGVRTLEHVLGGNDMNDARWAGIGHCLRRFHDAGVQHADLNARNILLGPDDGVWVLDFDRGRLRRPGPWRRRVLGRLERSLVKSFPAQDWRAGFEILRRAHDA